MMNQAEYEKLRSRPTSEIAGGLLFEVMDRSGDTKIIWDMSKPDEVENAKRTFNYLVKEKKHAAFMTKADGSQGEQVREWDPRAERLIFVPPMVGG